MEPEYGSPDPNQEPLELLLREISRAFDHDLQLLAMHGALTVPDICSAPETDTTQTRQRYIQWYNRYMPAVYTELRKTHPSRVRPGVPATFQFFPGKDAYLLRCKMLHQRINIRHATMSTTLRSSLASQICTCRFGWLVRLGTVSSTTCSSART